MKKLFIILALMVMSVFGILGVSFADLQGSNGSFSSSESNRMIPLRTKSVIHANTVISGNGADLFMITGVANSANSIFAVYNVGSIAAAQGGAATSQANIYVEGSEATQYDALGPYNFGPDGLRFDTGIVVITTTADLSIIYR